MREVEPARRARLFADAERIAAEHKVLRGDKFTSFIPTDYEAAYRTLCDLRDGSESFVELGAGAGVVTILADLLGFDAYGIEIDPWLVEQASELAARHRSRARFVCGTFVPRALRESVELHAADFVTQVDGDDAWHELGMELRDFDVVYDWHWPDESELHEVLLRRFCRRGAIILRYTGEHGFEVDRR